MLIRFTTFLYTSPLALLLGNRKSPSPRQSLVFLAVLLDRAACHEILQLLVGSQPQHYLATARSVPGPKIFVHDVEKLLKLERRTPGEDRNQLFSHEVRNSTGK